MDYSFKFIKKHLSLETLDLLKSSGKVIVSASKSNKSPTQIFSELKALFIWKPHTIIRENNLTIINGDFYISYCHENNKISMSISLNKKFVDDYNIYLIKNSKNTILYMYKDILYEEESDLQHVDEFYYVLNKSDLTIYDVELKGKIHAPMIKDIFESRYFSISELKDILKIKYDYTLKELAILDHIIYFRTYLDKLIKDIK